MKKLLFLVPLVFIGSSFVGGLGIPTSQITITVQRGTEPPITITISNCSEVTTAAILSAAFAPPATPSHAPVAYSEGANAAPTMMTVAATNATVIRRHNETNAQFATRRRAEATIPSMKPKQYDPALRGADAYLGSSAKTFAGQSSSANASNTRLVWYQNDPRAAQIEASKAQGSQSLLSVPIAIDSSALLHKYLSPPPCAQIYCAAAAWYRQLPELTDSITVGRYVGLAMGGVVDETSRQRLAKFIERVAKMETDGNLVFSPAQLKRAIRDGGAYALDLKLDKILYEQRTARAARARLARVHGRK